MTTNAIIRKKELVNRLNIADLAHKEVSVGKVMKGFKEVLGIVCRHRADFITAVKTFVAKLKTGMVEVEFDVQAIESEVVKTEPKAVTRPPIPVLVHWSESSVFRGEEQTYTFSEFEALVFMAVFMMIRIRILN
ncbi:MAG: hypothetical protein LBE93_02815 [Enterobacter asburiae]|jgi:hypothetical protein|nr:hypothetical protein [Enterobacter asburiae]